MTNAELIQKIRAEIERRIKKYATDVTMPLEVLGKVILELKGILSFLDTLESEKPMNQGGLEEEIDACWQSWLSPSNQKEVEEVLPKTEFAMYARHFAQGGAENLKK